MLSLVFIYIKELFYSDVTHYRIETKLNNEQKLEQHKNSEVKFMY